MSDISKIIIIRAENGWILQREELSGYDKSTYTVRDVFEDASGGLNNYIGRAESLSNLLWEAFSPEYQSNNHGGLSIEVKEHGSDHEEEISLETSKDPENRPKNSPDPLNIEKML
jgi:hypothetical protein